MKKVLTFIAVIAVAAMAFSSCNKKGEDSVEDTSAQALMQGWWEGTTMDFAFKWTESDPEPWNAWTQAYKGYGSDGIADIGNQDFYNIVKEGDKYYRYQYHNQADADFYYTKTELTVAGDTFTLESDYPAPGTSEVISMASSTEITNFSSVTMDAGLLDPGFAGTMFYYSCTVHFKKSAKPSWADTASQK